MISIRRLLGLASARAKGITRSLVSSSVPASKKASLVWSLLNTFGKALGGASLLGFLVYLVTLFRFIVRRKLKKLPPGPLPLPLIGSLHLVVKHFGPDGNPRIHTGLHDMCKEYGGIYGLMMGSCKFGT